MTVGFPGAKDLKEANEEGVAFLVSAEEGFEVKAVKHLNYSLTFLAIFSLTSYLGNKLFLP